MCNMITRKMSANLFERRLNRQTRVSKKDRIREKEKSKSNYGRDGEEGRWKWEKKSTNFSRMNERLKNKRKIGGKISSLNTG